MTESGSGGLKNIYLKAYNLLSALGWLYVAVLTVKTTLTWKDSNDFFQSKNLYTNVRKPLITLLATAYLEVFHAVVKLVPSNPSIVFMQVFARFICVVGVADVFKVCQASSGVSLMLICWSISEVTRYLYYVDSSAYLLKWCRYSFFLVIYPIGAFGELLCYWNAAEYIQPLNIRRQYSINLPNKYNISFDTFIVFWAVMIIYPPAFYVMYNHMLHQRKKMLYRIAKNEQKKNE